MNIKRLAQKYNRYHKKDNDVDIETVDIVNSQTYDILSKKIEQSRKHLEKKLQKFFSNIKDGVDGRDGVDGKDGQDGKDGVDGKDGQDGKDGVDGKDGQDGKDGGIIKTIVHKISTNFTQIARGLEELKGDERLSATALRDLPREINRLASIRTGGNDIEGNDKRYVNVTGDRMRGSLDMDRKGLKNIYQNVITVAKSGGDFDDIQDAIDSVTDATILNPYKILIGPGLWEFENLEIKTNISYEGSGQVAKTILSGNIMISGNKTEAEFCDLKEIFFYDGAIDIDFSQNYTKFIQFDKCFFNSNSIPEVPGGQVTINYDATNNYVYPEIIPRHSIYFLNCGNSAINVFNGGFVDSQKTSFANSITLNNGAYMQQMYSEMNGTLTLNDTVRCQLRGASATDEPLSIVINNDAMLQTDNSIDSSKITIVNNTGSESAIEILSGYSAGIISPAPIITNNGDGSVTVGEGAAFLYDNDHMFGLPRRYVIPEKILSLTNDSQNYITVNYNLGEPEYQVSTNNVFNESNIIPVATEFREGIILHEFSYDSIGEGLVSKIHQRMLQVDDEKFGRDYGIELSETPTRVVNVTNGRLFVGAIPIILDLFVSTTDPLDFYYHVAGEWSKNTITQYNNVYYDDGTDLVELLPNKFVVNWIYRGLEEDAHCYCVAGNSQYNTLGLAELEPKPADLPNIIKEHTALIGRIIVEKNINTGTVLSIWDKPLTGSGVIEHDSLASINLAGAGVTYGHINNLTQTIAGAKTFASPITSSNYISNAAAGTQPYACTSTTLNTNLNADMVDSRHAGVANGLATLDAGGKVPSSQLPNYDLVYARQDGTTFTGKVSMEDNLDVAGIIDVGTDGNYSADGLQGIDDSFRDADGNIFTIKKGIIVGKISA